MAKIKEHKELTNEEAALAEFGKVCFVTNRFLINQNKSRIIELYKKLKECKKEES